MMVKNSHYKKVRNLLFVADLIIYFVVIFITENETFNKSLFRTIGLMCFGSVFAIAEAFATETSTKLKKWGLFGMHFGVWALFIFGCWWDKQ